MFILSKNKKFYFIVFLFLLFFFEFTSFIFLKFFDLRYQNTIFNNVSIKNDTILGWDSYNGSPRPSIAFPDEKKEDFCGFIFGDSFSHADEVLDQETWGDLLSKKIGCPIANFGVGGFGTDQALLKMEKIINKKEKNFNSKKKIIFFGVYEEMLKRNVAASWLFYCCPNKKKSLKPYFILQNQNSIKLIKIPEKITLTNVIEHHKYDKYYPIYTAKFPYTIEIFKNFFNRVQNFLKHNYNFIISENSTYNDNQKLNIQYLLMKRAADFATNKGFKIIFIFFPTPNEAYYGKNIYNNFKENTLETFKNNIDISVIDLLPELNKVKELKKNQLKAPEGHYNAEGNKQISRIIFEKLYQ
jgi:hypothetical protein